MGDPPGGGEAAELTPVATHSLSFVEQNPLGIGARNWGIAEKAAREIIRKVQPTSVSEERRGEVVDYIQRLIRNRLSVEVFPYGSVPLRTFLPDGDIDLTAFGCVNIEDPLVDDIKYVLEQEEKSMASGFVVKDVQLIRAEVKLVKCIVQDIVVDVSFNQIGGLCTLCFLEQVDQFIGKDHLFKRSIILTKAWCYYESRILGAHHGLISTYALETLVLYIFQLFHSMLDGPLAVLYKFLDYFSNFDWETYSVSLNGPVRLSSMPDIVVDMPEESDRDLLLSNDFLSSCVGLFSLPSRGGNKNSRGFQRKHLNIVDPLNEINNLGRSVSKGSFYRIRSAFSYGARKLGQILSQREGSIPSELHKFFLNTMARHGGQQKPHLQDFDPSIISKRPASGVLSPDNAHEFDDSNVSGGHIQSSSVTLSQDLFKGPKHTSSDIASNTGQYSNFLLQHPVVSLDWYQASKLSTLGPQFHEDVKDLSTLGLGGLAISADSSIFNTLPQFESASASEEPPNAPQLYSESKLFNSRTQDGSSDSDKLALSRSNGEKVVEFGSLNKKQSVGSAEVMTSSKSKDLSWAQMTSSSVDLTAMDLEQVSSGKIEASESLRTSDLTGDYVRFLHWLQFGRWCYEYGSNRHSLTMPPLPIVPCDSLLSPSHFEHNGFSHRHYNGYHPSPAVYVLHPLVLPAVPFGLEEVAQEKPTGTGTYFPYTAQPPRGYRPSSMRGRNRGSSSSPRNKNMIFAEPNMMIRSSLEPSEPQVPVDKIVMAHIDNHSTVSPRGNGFPKANGASIQPEGVNEFELVGPSSGKSMPDKIRQQTSASLSPRNSSGLLRPKPALSREQDR